jgi:hypothetical protein
LGLSVPLFCSFAKPLRRGGVVLRHAATFCVEESEHILRKRISSLGLLHGFFEKVSFLCRQSDAKAGNEGEADQPEAQDMHIVLLFFGLMQARLERNPASI